MESVHSVLQSEWDNNTLVISKQPLIIMMSCMQTCDQKKFVKLNIIIIYGINLVV